MAPVLLAPEPAAPRPEPRRGLPPGPREAHSSWRGPRLRGLEDDGLGAGASHHGVHRGPRSPRLPLRVRAAEQGLRGEASRGPDQPRAVQGHWAGRLHRRRALDHGRGRGPRGHRRGEAPRLPRPGARLEGPRPQGRHQEHVGELRRQGPTLRSALRGDADQRGALPAAVVAPRRRRDAGIPRGSRAPAPGRLRRLRGLVGGPSL
mmetsp:Transcript_45512/g.134733  ORF Transcript_45512/g.134733 Transcript_45512/m.134733 type:complete len:205 (-) Transcript_45512:27-641(-)